MYRCVTGIVTGLPVSSAVMFLNSNQSSSSLQKIIQESRQKCSMAGIALQNKCIVSKGPDRDIDRDAVNMLITQLLTGQYDTVVVMQLADLTEDRDDLEEFMQDAAKLGIGFFELSTMQYHMYEKRKPALYHAEKIQDGGILFC